MTAWELLFIVTAFLALLTGLGLVVEKLSPEPVEPWDPHTAGFARCGLRECPNPHPAQPWMDRTR